MSAPHLITRRAPIPAGSFDRKARTFTAVAATNTPVARYDWSTGAPVNEVLVIDAKAIDLGRFASGRAPLLNGHRAGSTADQIGVIRAARIEAGQLVIEGELSPRADVAGIADDLAAGVLGNVSVGYRVLARERVENGTGKTDTIRVTRWEPIEVSLVPVPADPAAHVRSGVSSMDPEEIEGGAAVITPPPTRAVSVETRAERRRIADIGDLATRAGMPAADAQAAIEAGTTVEEFRHRAFDVVAARANGKPTSSISPGPGVEGTNGIAQAIQGALYARMSGTAPEGRAREFMGRSLLEMGTALLESRGERVRWSDRDQLAEQILRVRSNFDGAPSRGMHSTSDFPILLTLSGNRVLNDAYQLATTPLKTLARQRTRTDFKPVTAVQLSEAPRLLKVNEKGEISHGTRAEEGRPLYQVATYARLFSLSRNAIINDDLNAFADALSAFGQGAAQTENDELVGLFTANGGAGVTMFDGKPLYHASHGNLAGMPAALSVDALGLGRQALRSMKGIDGKTPINVVPAHLVVGSALETAAEKVLTQLMATQVQDANPFPGKLALHVEPRFMDNSWRLFANPGAMATIEIAYLAGREGPQLSFKEGWEVLGVEFRAVLDFGCGARDWRGTYQNAGQ